MTEAERSDRPEQLAETDDLEFWATEAGEDRYVLSELVNRLLDKGVVITGDVTISVAGVDLIYLGLSVILTSVSTARRHIDQMAERKRSGE